ncbi:hypothetical protein JNK13_08195 [bacterium]|nr:hypothetical protein [bacterium]
MNFDNKFYTVTVSMWVVKIQQIGDELGIILPEEITNAFGLVAEGEFDAVIDGRNLAIDLIKQTNQEE